LIGGKACQREPHHVTLNLVETQVGMVGLGPHRQDNHEKDGEKEF